MDKEEAKERRNKLSKTEQIIKELENDKIS
jgi:hypothetical protein